MRKNSAKKSHAGVSLNVKNGGKFRSNSELFLTPLDKFLRGYQALPRGTDNPLNKYPRGLYLSE